MGRWTHVYNSLKKALAAFTAAQLAGAGELEQRLQAQANHFKGKIVNLHLVDDLSDAASTISALRAEVLDKERGMLALEQEIIALRSIIDSTLQTRGPHND